MSTKIAVVCALREELSAVKAGLGTDAGRFELIQAGVGARAAARVGKELASRENPAALVVSTGFCGGLSDALKVGDIVAAHNIVGIDAGGLPAPQNLVRAKMLVENQIAGALDAAKLRWECGSIVCSREPILKSEDKRALHVKSGAIAVDMESFALAESVDAAGTAVVVLRAVSDSVEDELPAEVAEFLDERGKVRVGKITRFVLKRPANITRLMSLKKRADKAAASLTLAWSAMRGMENCV